MATQPDPLTVSPSNLRQLARDNQELGRRLADHEYRAVIAELSSPEVFDLEIDFPDLPAPTLNIPLLTEEREVAHLPQLNVTLGTMAWVYDASRLPVIGIFCPPVETAGTREALSALLTAHYAKPFARFVFLCSDLRIVPFLGRYQLAYESLGRAEPNDVATRLARRFGMTEIRNLITGNRIWSAPKKAT